MARVRLNILAAETCKLPHVCLCCGAPSTTGVTHKFYYDPTWLATIGMLLPWYIRYHFASQSLTFPVPLCARHTWRLKLPTYLGYAFALILLLFAPLAVLAHYGELPLARDILLVGFALFLPIGLLVLMGVRLFSPRMVDYDSRSALLVNVARGFAEAIDGRKLPGLPEQTAVRPGASRPCPHRHRAELGLDRRGVRRLRRLDAGLRGHDAGRRRDEPRQPGPAVGPVGCPLEGNARQDGCGARDQFLAERGGPPRPAWTAPPEAPPAPPPSSAAPTATATGFGNPTPPPVAPATGFGVSNTPPVATPPQTPAETTPSPQTSPAETAPKPAPTRPRNAGAAANFPPNFPPGFPGLPEGVPRPPFGVPGQDDGFGPDSLPTEAPRGQPPNMRGRGSRRPAGSSGSEEQREEFQPGPRGQFPPLSKPVTAASQLRPGASVWVLWGSTWYRSLVLSAEGRGAKVHYLGWGSGFDRVVARAGNPPVHRHGAGRKRRLRPKAATNRRAAAPGPMPRASSRWRPSFWKFRATSWC